MVTKSSGAVVCSAIAQGTYLVTALTEKKRQGHGALLPFSQPQTRRTPIYHQGEHRAAARIL
jgi:hypothetical protein